MQSQHYNLDAAESAFFNRQLEFVYSATYDIKYPDLMYKQFCPQSTEADPGALTVTYEQYNEVGRARVGSHFSSAPPRVDINGLEFTRPVRPIEASYGWTVQDVKSAQMAKKNLNQRRAAACRRAIEREIDEIAAIGAPLVGIATGMLNDANVTINASAGSWLTPATAAVIIGEVSTMYQDIVTDTQQIERPDTLILPVARWVYIATTARGDDNDTTILDFIRKSFPGLTAVEPWYRIDDAGAAGVTRAMMYPRRSDIMQNELPLDFEQLPVQASGFQFVVNCHARTAGVAVYYPVACRYLDGL